jgi:hypothetical protein
MKKTAVNLWLNVLAFVNFLALAATGAIMRWVLPPGSGGGQGGGEGLARGWRGGRSALDLSSPDGSRIRSLLGWKRHDWGDLHFWLAVALVTIIILHLALHWSWVRCNILPRWLGGKR